MLPTRRVRALAKGPRDWWLGLAAVDCACNDGGAAAAAVSVAVGAAFGVALALSSGPGTRKGSSFDVSSLATKEASAGAAHLPGKRAAATTALPRSEDVVAREAGSPTSTDHGTAVSVASTSRTHVTPLLRRCTDAGVRLREVERWRCCGESRVRPRPRRTPGLPLPPRVSRVSTVMPRRTPPVATAAPSSASLPLLLLLLLLLLLA